MGSIKRFIVVCYKACRSYYVVLIIISLIKGGKYCLGGGVFVWNCLRKKIESY